MVELFVTHQKTLQTVYTILFPQTSNIDKKYQNLNITDKSSVDYLQRVSAGEERVNTSSFLDDPSLFQELLQGDLYQSPFEQRNGS